MKKKMYLFIITYLAYVSIYIARVNLSMASPGLIEGQILDNAELGIMAGLFSVVYAFGRLINGGLSDKCPPWIMISVGLVFSGAANVLCSFFPPFIGMCILWTVNAFAQSMLWSSVLCIVAAIYDEKKAKKMTSYMVTSVATGNIIAILLTTGIIEKFGLAFAFAVPGAITLIMAGFIALNMRNIKAPGAKSAQHIPIFRLFSDKGVRKIIFPAFFHGVIKENITVWMTVYFVAKFGVNLEESAMFVLFIPVVGFVGRMIYPFLFGIFKEKEHTVSNAAFIICTLASALLSLGLGSPVVAAVSMSIIYAAVSVINTSILSIFPLRYSSTGNVASISGVMDLATYGGGGIGSLIYGFVIKGFGYTPMVVSWIVISVISIIILRTLKEKENI